MVLVDLENSMEICMSNSSFGNTSNCLFNKRNFQIKKFFQLVIIATAVFGGNELIVNNTKFPGWAHGIGWAISMTPISAIVICAVIQAFKYNFNWVHI